MNSKTITDPIHKNVPFAEYLFGPLPKVYCIYFEILTILTFFVLLLFLFIFIFSLFDYSPKSKGFSFVSFLALKAELTAFRFISSNLFSILAALSIILLEAYVLVVIILEPALI